MIRHGFFGGAPQNTAFSAPIESLPPPPQVVLAVPARPGVKAGDYVAAGQKIADPGGGVPGVHAPIAGRVSAIGPRVQGSGASELSVVVDNDFSDTLSPAVRPPADPASLPLRQLLTLIQEAGIADGDGSPILSKIAAGVGRTDTVIICACEKEPYMAGNCRLVLERTAELLEGAGILAKLYGVDRVHIALGSEQREAIQTLRDKIRENKSPAVVDAVSLPYPQNAERPLCRAITRRRIPPGAGAAAVGCAVVDAGAVYAVYEAVYLGRPLTHRVVTVAGSGIQQPRNLLCPIGTPIRFLLDACGGVDPKTYKIVLGGPVTGRAQYDMDAPLGRDDGAVLAFCGDEERASAHPRCIRCGRCIRACPAGLRPVVMYREMQAGRQTEQLSACIQCGACTYVCPGRMPLLQAFRAERKDRV